MGSACVMNFKRETQKIDVVLPARSLLIMTGEVRYAWTHGICSRHSDVIEIENGTTIQERSIRVSFTFRKVRRGDCHCSFKEYCDTAKRDNISFIDADAASGLENSYVHEVRKLTEIYDYLLIVDITNIDLLSGLRGNIQSL